MTGFAIRCLFWLSAIVVGFYWLSVYSNHWLYPGRLPVTRQPQAPMRTLQLAPCGVGTVAIGRWNTAYVCLEVVHGIDSRRFAG